MSDAAVADRYARAIFELGKETGQLDQLTRQLGAFADTYVASTELRRALDNPRVPQEERMAVLETVASRLSAGQLAKNTLKLLADRRRLRVIRAIAQRLTHLADEKAGVVRATVISAKPLGESFVTKLKAELEKKSSRKVILERETDPSILGGVITRIGDQIIDGSLRGRLAELERQLLG